MLLMNEKTIQVRSLKDIRIGVLLLAVLALVFSMPATAEVRAHLDRSKVYIGDAVTLVIESTGGSSGEPDLSPLNKDFRVLGTGTSTQFSFSNGRSSNRTSWTVQLGPLQAGTLRIPAIQVGTEQTKALELEVTEVPDQPAAKQSEQLFLEAEADTGGNAYVQQQIPYTLRLYHDETLVNGELRPPPLRDALIRQLGDDRRYSVTRNNRRYQVVERRYAVSPQKSGELRIPPASFVGQIDTQPPGGASRRSDLMQQFLRNSPFGGGRPVRVFSKPISIDVQPRPANAGSDWLPAEHIELHDSWASEPPEFRAGEPVTRTISLRATGLSGTQIPALQLEQPQHTRVYPETPVNESRTDGDKVYAISRQTFTYIPARAGELMVPAVEVPWWNTVSDEQSTARLPEWVLNVEPGATGVPAAAMEAPPREEPAIVPEERQTRIEPQVQGESWLVQAKALLWPWGALMLLILAAAFLARRWFGGLDRAAGTVDMQAAGRPEARAPGIELLLPQLQRACEASDAKQAAQALLELGRARWPDEPPRSLGQLAVRLGYGQEQITMLDRALYAAETSSWNGAALWAFTKDAWSKKPIRQKPTDDGLEPLYPQNG
jgi:hypothetical protein